MPENRKTLSVVWTNRAENGYAKIIEYILDKFSIREAESLDEKLNTLIEKIATFRHICPLSKKKNIHKCVVHKNTSLLYTIKKNELAIVMVLDNRMKHSY